MASNADQHSPLLGRITPTPLLGDEPFRGGLAGTAASDFWRWASSDLLSNATRGILAEFIVARALGAVGDVRSEWAAFDLRLPDGTTIEVKSAAYIQSWHQERPSRITFGIAPTLAWDPDTGRFAAVKRRQADVYVFCLLGRPDQSAVDPLDLGQWRFFVLPTTMLDERLPTGKAVGLSTLLALRPEESSYGDLPQAVARVLARGSDA